MAISDETQEFFTQQASEAGIPTTAAELKTQFQTAADDAGLTISNASGYSAFWNFVVAVVTTPVLALLQYLVGTVTPNMFLRYATGSWLDLHGWARNTDRTTATATKGGILFTRTGTGTTLTVPYGTVIKTPAINGTVYRVTTSEAYTFAADELTATIPVVAENTGSAYNLAAGYFTVLAEAITGVASVTNADDWITTAGTDDEDDDDFRERLRLLFPSVADWHIDAVYKSIIAEQTGVPISNIWINSTLAPRGAGSADAYVMLDVGTISATALAAVNSHINDDGNHGHGDDLQVVAFPETQHDVITKLYAAAGTSADDMAAAADLAEQIIRFAFRENAAFDETDVTRVRFLTRFSFAKLASQIRALVPVLTAVEFNEWSLMPGEEIPRLNSLAVTITEDAS
ncbi:baseplate J/gp47 family protein [Oceanobacter mangrovi]|uniref:baseplate J/gp47 family protein n=1 Tax=Oceanobacter mangrovi TaxID=2862510 RepID=UPI001C8EC29D|nr:baseplate J/gp47 family protein [Oceanobacter mangrovi]